MSLASALTTLFNDKIVDPTREDKDPSETNRAVLADQNQVRETRKRLRKSWTSAIRQLESWVKDLGIRGTGSGLVLGDWAVIQLWSTRKEGEEEVKGEPMRQEIILARTGSPQLIDKVLVVTPKIPMYQALIGLEQGVETTWIGDVEEGETMHAIVLESAWIPTLLAEDNEAGIAGGKAISA